MTNKMQLTLKGLFFSTATLTVLSAVPASAAVFNATFLSTADNSGFNSPYVDNVSFGDAFKVVIALDNGGSSLLNQTWNASHVISVTFDFGNGAHTTVFDPNGGMVSAVLLVVLPLTGQVN